MMLSYAKTIGLMVGMTVLLVGVAGYFGGTTWMGGALVFATLLNFGSYWFSDRIVLRMYRAEVVDLESAPELYELVDRLRRRAGLPMPTVAIADQAQPNAFATGRNPENAVVCCTRGILEILDRDQLAGVIGHELAHIKNRDMLIGAVAATLAGAIVMLARLGFFFGGGRDRGGLGLVGMLLMLILAPLAAVLVRSAISRNGEYRADRGGAEISGRPLALAGALRRLEAGAERIPMEVNEAASHLCIVNPLSGGGGSSFVSLFSTHPPTEERVRRLEAMDRREG